VSNENEPAHVRAMWLSLDQGEDVFYVLGLLADAYEDVGSSLAEGLRWAVSEERFPHPCYSDDTGAKVSYPYWWFLEYIDGRRYSNCTPQVLLDRMTCEFWPKDTPGLSRNYRTLASAYRALAGAYAESKRAGHELCKH